MNTNVFGISYRIRIATWIVVVGSLLVGSPANAEERYLDTLYDFDTEIDVQSDVPYGAAVNVESEWETLLLDIYQPKEDLPQLAEDPASLTRPAIVWAHGGGFTSGSKTSPYHMNDIEQLATAGYVVFSINYRLRPNVPQGTINRVPGLDERFDAQTDGQHDAQAAIRYIKANAQVLGVDPDGVAIVGYSAGGITAMRVAFNSHDVGDSGNPGYSSRPAAAVAFGGGGIPGRSFRIDPDEPPLLIVHGLADQTVPYPTAAIPCFLTIAHVNVCEQVLGPDEGHVTFGHAHVLEFLYRWLTDRPLLRDPTRLTIVPFAPPLWSRPDSWPRTEEDDADGRASFSRRPS